jgi:hypothetical protein
MFGRELINCFQDCPRTGCHCVNGRDGRYQPTSQLHTYLEGKAFEEVKIFMDLGSGSFEWIPLFWFCVWQPRFGQ